MRENLLLKIKYFPREMNNYIINIHPVTVTKGNRVCLQRELVNMYKSGASFCFDI